MEIVEDGKVELAGDLKSFIICTKRRLGYNRERDQITVLVDSIEPFEGYDINFFISIWQGDVADVGSWRA